MEVLLRTAAFLLKCIGFLLTPFLTFFNSYKKTKIPPIKNDLINICVVDLAQKIRKQEVSYTNNNKKNQNFKLRSKKKSTPRKHLNIIGCTLCTLLYFQD